MAKPKPRYVDTRTLIDGSPNLAQIAAIETPSADQLLVYNGNTKEFEVADLGTGLSLSGGSVVAEGAVTSVNGQTAVVVLDADDISDSGTANKWNATHTGEVTGATGRWSG